MKSVVDFLSDLVRIPSSSALSNRPVIDYAAEILHAAGWSSRRMTFADPSGVEKVNLLAAPPLQDLSVRSADLVFVCHTDTVPSAAGWSDALSPVVQEGALHGCGACDVKGFLACLLSAAGKVATSQYARDLRIVLTADEEIGCLGAARLLAADAIRPRRLVIGEPTSLYPARAGKGYCLAEVTVSGKEAHSAHPGHGASAIYGAARLITAIEDFAGELATETNLFFDPPFTTINVGTVHGGTAKNIVPGVCQFQLEWRPIPGRAANAVLAYVTNLVSEISAASPGLFPRIQLLRQQPGFETPANTAHVRQMESLTGRPAISIPFGSEASVFAAAAAELVVFGPGDMRTAHSCRECVPLAELDTAVSILMALMRSA